AIAGVATGIPGLPIISAASSSVSAFGSPVSVTTSGNSCRVWARAGGCARVSNSTNACPIRARWRATDKPVTPVPMMAFTLLVAIIWVTVISLLTLTQLQRCQADQYKNHGNNPKAHDNARLGPAF